VANLVSVEKGDDDTLWAVVATLGRVNRVAEVYRSRARALEDRAATGSSTAATVAVSSAASLLRR